MGESTPFSPSTLLTLVLSDNFTGSDSNSLASNFFAVVLNGNSLSYPSF